MTISPHSPTPSLDDVTAAIARLRADLQQHEEAAATIRATLADLRKQLAGLGRRAGPKARSGRRRLKGERPLPFPGGEPAQPVDDSPVTVP